MSIVRFLCSLWEVHDKLPEGRFTAVVAMSGSPKKGGKIGGVLAKVMTVSIDHVRSYQTERLILSNSFTVKTRWGKNISLAEFQNSIAVERGVDAGQIINPSESESTFIRNTYTEARFAVDVVRKLNSYGREKSLLIVANHLHMRRVLLTVLKLVEEEDDIIIYYHSAGDESDYGWGYMQRRFLHPILYLGYEIGAMVYSLWRGWI